MIDAVTKHTIDFVKLHESLLRLRGDVTKPPHASIVIPVNAQGDLENVLQVASDIATYNGQNRIEFILVINNYDADSPPEEIAQYDALGFRVVAIPNVRKPGEAPGFTARIPGIRAADSNTVIMFDADCRIPNATAIIDWYIKVFEQGATLAYSHVGYYDMRDTPSIRMYLIVHHTSRWFKRNILGIPTNRGSNYTVDKPFMLEMYDANLLADEMNVGPTFKSKGKKIVYSGKKDFAVLTSGRMYKGGWLRIFRHLIYRLRYNLRVLPVGTDVASRTKREKDKVRRYVDNQPVD